MNLLLNRFITDNRTGDKLRKQSHIHGKIDQRMSWSDLTAVYIHNITDRLEGKKADAKRHDDMHKRNGCSNSVIECINQKIRIFEDYQLSKIKDNRTHQKPSAPVWIFLHCDTCCKVYSDCHKHDNDSASFAIEIKQQ